MSENLASTIDGLNQSLVKKKIKKQEAANKSGLNNVGDSDLHKNLFISKDRDVSLKNSDQQTALFHFKVIQLRTHLDTGGKSECKVKFHFLKELIVK